jgi:hypothetical protein
MPSSGMRFHVSLVKTDVSKERIASSMRVKRNNDVGKNVSSNQQLKHVVYTANIVPSSLILLTLIMEVICSFETSVLTVASYC